MEKLASAECAIVPIKIHATAFTDKDIGGHLVGPSTGFSDSNGKLSSTHFEPRTITAADTGLHLHWQLPVPFTSGQASSYGDELKSQDFSDLNLPPVPNRWLVMRSYGIGYQPQKWHDRSWIVESDFVSPEFQAGSPTLPLDPSARSPHLRYFLGRVLDARGWHEPGGQNSLRTLTGWDLTALGWGDPGFSSFYPNCRNVFGLFDPLEIVPESDRPVWTPAGISRPAGHCKYTVIGWHTHPQDDPLSRGTDRPRWAFDKDPGGGRMSRMTRSLYVGHMPDVVWEPTRKFSEPNYDSPKGSRITYSFGNNIEESMAAMCVKTYKPNGSTLDLRAISDQVNAALTGIDNSVLKTHSATIQAETHLHALRFSPQDGGDLWIIRKKSNSANTGEISDDGTVDTESLDLDLPDPILDALDAINLVQRDYDYAANRWLNIRQRTRHDLHLLEQLALDPASLNAALVTAEDLDAARKRTDPIDEYIRANQKRFAERRQAAREALHLRYEQDTAAAASPNLDHLRRRIDSLHSDLPRLLSPFPDLELVRIPAPRYWKPKDPVILIHGPRVITGKAANNGQFNYYEDGRHLLCAEIPPDLPNIVADGQMTASMAVLPSWVSVERLAKTIGQLITNNFSDRYLFRLLDSHSDTTMTIYPRYLRWCAGVRSLTRMAGPEHAYKKDSLTAHWGFLHGKIWSEMSPSTANEFEHPSDERPLSGVSMLDLTSAEPLMYRAGSAIQSIDRKMSLEHASGYFGNQMASATLSGFHNRMLMLEPRLDIPVKDRAALLHLDEIPKWLQSGKEGDDLRPQPHVRQSELSTLFTPLRGGTLNLYSLAVYDSFGRVIDDSNNIVVSNAVDPYNYATPTSPLKQLSNHLSVFRHFEKLFPPSERKTPEVASYGIATLPPRLCSASRLTFRWKKYNFDELKDRLPADGPVCGWLMPSHVDNNVMIASAEGDLLGVLSAEDGSSPAYYPVRTGPLPPGIHDIVDALKSGQLNFDSFIADIDKEIEQFIPGSKTPTKLLSRLIGRPLAVVSAELGIDVFGDLPPRIQTIPQPGSSVECGLMNLQIPLLLGDPIRKNDGLIGFFIRSANKWDTSFFHTPHKMLQDNVNPIPLSFAQQHDGKRTPLLMLVDPHEPVHASTGILPIKAITLPQHYYRKALERLSFAAVTGPVLLPNADAWSFPLPAMEGKVWQWSELMPGAPWQPVTKSTAIMPSEIHGVKSIKGRILMALHDAPVMNPPAENINPPTGKQ